jgi:hypothetical protein
VRITSSSPTTRSPTSFNREVATTSSRRDDVSLSKGDKIQAIGRKGRVDGQDVFVAHSIKIDGKTIDANPAIRLRTASTYQDSRSGSVATPQSQTRTATQNPQSGQSQRTIQGKVAGFSSSNDVGKRNHTVLNLRLENGKSEMIDLGPGASPDRIGLYLQQQFQRSLIISNFE